MPQIFRMGEYWIYFWTNESKPTESIHMHISKGKTRIPMHTLRNIMRMIEARSADIIQKWYSYFGEVHYYC